MSGRHADLDPVETGWLAVWAILGSVLLTLLGMAVREPCPCDPGAARLVPVSAHDRPDLDV